MRISAQWISFIHVERWKFIVYTCKIVIGAKKSRFGKLGGIEALSSEELLREDLHSRSGWILNKYTGR